MFQYLTIAPPLGCILAVVVIIVLGVYGKLTDEEAGLLIVLFAVTLSFHLVAMYLFWLVFLR